VSGAPASCFDGAPAFVEANANVVWRGTVAELRRMTAPATAEFGWPMAHAALDECVAEWLRDRKPSEPRPWCIRRIAVSVPGLNILVGVGAP
jgi:hypothetical protein